MGVTCPECDLRYWVEIDGDPEEYVDGYRGMRYCPHCGVLR